MSKSTVIELSDPDLFTDSLTELLRTGARQLIEQAVEAELSEFMKQYADQVLGNGRSAIVRNGYLPEREIQTGIGPVTVKIPKVRAKSEERVTFRSALVPPYVRKTRSLEAALPWLYLKGISTEEMGSALEVLVGPGAKGLSASTVARLKQRWAEDYRYWREMRLDKDQWVYIWMGFTAVSEPRMRNCARWLSSALMPVGRSVFWRSKMVCGNRPKAGGKCC